MEFTSLRHSEKLLLIVIGILPVEANNIHEGGQRMSHVISTAFPML